jgi:hypothetical protein
MNMIASAAAAGIAANIRSTRSLSSVRFGRSVILPPASSLSS